MSLFSSISSASMRWGSRALLVAKKYSPEILTVVGVTTVGAGVIMACKASTKVVSIHEEFKSSRQMIEDAKALHEAGKRNDYDRNAYLRDKAFLYTFTVKKYVKLYAVPVSSIIFGLSCLVGSSRILKKRNVAITAAYKAVEEAYKNYRADVADAIGVEAEQLIARGQTLEDVETEKDGEKVKESVPVSAKNPSDYSPYARIFDETNMNWNRDNGLNRFFLSSQQNYANDRLKHRGHVFLNEVYDMLGFPRTSQGAIVGWVLNGEGDGYIDLGMFDTSHPKAVDFINGYENSIVIDPNVDGIIYDLI